MPSLRTPYQILNLSPDAEPVVIEAAYRALIKKYHPDLWLGDPNHVDAGGNRPLADDLPGFVADNDILIPARAAGSAGRIVGKTVGKLPAPLGAKLDPEELWHDSAAFAVDCDGGFLLELGNRGADLGT